MQKYFSLWNFIKTCIIRFSLPLNFYAQGYLGVPRIFSSFLVIWKISLQFLMFTWKLVILRSNKFRVNGSRSLVIWHMLLSPWRILKVSSHVCLVMRLQGTCSLFLWFHLNVVVSIEAKWKFCVDTFFLGLSPLNLQDCRKCRWRSDWGSARGPCYTLLPGWMQRMQVLQIRKDQPLW